MSEADVLSQFPQLTSEDNKASMAYTAERQRRTGTAVGYTVRLLFDEQLANEVCELLRDAFLSHCMVGGSAAAARPMRKEWHRRTGATDIS